MFCLHCAVCSCHAVEFVSTNRDYPNAAKHREMSAQHRISDSQSAKTFGTVVFNFPGTKNIMFRTRNS